MTNLELHKDLRRNNITGDLILAIIDYKYSGSCRKISDLSRYYNTRDFLMHGLYWTGTPQGYNFWSKVFDIML